MSAKAIGILQARTGSSRLPAKIFRRIFDDSTMLDVISARLMKIDIEWWLATTQESEDDLLAKKAEDLGFNVFRGETDDVLSRFESIVELRNPSWVVRATGDNPTVAFEAVPTLLDFAKSIGQSEIMVADSKSGRRYPAGHIPQVISVAAIRRMREYIDPRDRHHLTHVTSVMYSLNRVLSLPETVKLGCPMPDLRWTVDEESDLDLMKELFGNLAIEKSKKLATYSMFLEVYDRLPYLRNINAKVIQKPIEIG